LQVTIDAQKTSPPISKYLYGQFIEHIRSTMYSSLWAEMLDDRKFYFSITAAKPEPPSQPGGGPFGGRLHQWHPVGGDGIVVMDKSQPFVGEQSPRVSLDATTPHGIEQSDPERDGPLYRLPHHGRSDDGRLAHRLQQNIVHAEQSRPRVQDGTRSVRIASSADSTSSSLTPASLPFRFLAAARSAPQWEEGLERAMFRAVHGAEKLAGKTVLLVDVSGSMTWKLSAKSEMLRTDAAFGLAVLLREVCERVVVYTFSNVAKMVAPRHGFALRDAMARNQPNGGTNLGASLRAVEAAETYDRLIVITDEQSHDHVPAPKGKGYVINVASARNGVGYGEWTHIDGWSEAVIEYIRELEALA
jgi:hypothetical protein